MAVATRADQAVASLDQRRAETWELQQIQHDADQRLRSSCVLSAPIGGRMSEETIVKSQPSHSAAEESSGEADRAHPGESRCRNCKMLRIELPVLRSVGRSRPSPTYALLLNKMARVLYVCSISSVRNENHLRAG